MYPDILMMCSPMECIPPYTLHSILKFAPKSKVILYVSAPIHMDNESLLSKRIKVLKQSESEYVLFLDSDDALDTHILPIKNLQSHEAHFYCCYDMDTKKQLSPSGTNISKLFGFHMIICKRELALNVLQKYEKESQQVYREDVCFFYGILTQATSIKYHKTCLTMKIGSRVVRYAPDELRRNFRNDIRLVWEEKFKKYREQKSSK